MLKRYIAQEEVNASAEPITVDDIFTTYVDDDDENCSEKHVRALEAIDVLQAANEAWQLIVNSAVKENRVTPELCAGIEAHFSHMYQELGETIDEERASIESTGGDVNLFLTEVQSSLESFSDKLGKIKNFVLNSLSNFWHRGADRKKQIQSLEAISELATKISAKVKSEHDKELNKEVDINTGRYTVYLMSAGKVVTDPVKAIATHVHQTLKLYTTYSTVVIDGLIDLVNTTGKLMMTNDIYEIMTIAAEVPKLLTPSELVPSWADKGEGLLGNIRLAKPPKERSKQEPNESTLKYIKRRSSFGMPHWKKIGPTAEPVSIKMNYRNVIACCDSIKQLADKLIPWFGLLEKQYNRVTLKIDTINYEKNPFRHNFVYVKAIMDTVRSETVGGLYPIQQLAYRNMSILRGLLGYLSKA